MPLQPTDWQQPVDVFWDEMIEKSARKVSLEIKPEQRKPCLVLQGGDQE
jgi:hypothetical protein